MTSLNETLQRRCFSKVVRRFHRNYMVKLDIDVATMFQQRHRAYWEPPTQI